MKRWNFLSRTGTITTAKLHLPVAHTGFRMAGYGLLLGLSLAAAAAKTNAPVTNMKLPAKEKLHLYLMMGQSNMSGRGIVGEEDRTPHARVLMFDTNGVWQPAIEPVTHDKPKMVGVGPGLAFGKAMAEHSPEVVIGLVPCSVGGTPLSRWVKGGDLYSNAVFRAQCAQRSGTLKGVIWHQGESDSNAGHAATYGLRLGQMIQDLRADLNTPELPFVAGQLGEYLYARTNRNGPEVRIVNAAITELPGRIPHTGFVSSTGLTHKGDQLHFDAVSQREMGRRFAAAMIALTP